MLDRFGRPRNTTTMKIGPEKNVATPELPCAYECKCCFPSTSMTPWCYRHNQSSTADDENENIEGVGCEFLCEL
ncbi:hypothetical protein Bca52824_023780 [Brassica carinata]|uniref:Uncharacterized protein n=1 Tax=Brassica carinata TaxID=52824 RepID=A0A8X7VJE1_BRACI|nr:hypothetical protein Bca52824_023780 [Brassica carinata]